MMETECSELQASLLLFRSSLSFLTEREIKVLRMRFNIDTDKIYALDEIAEHFNVTRERIRQIEAKALRKLRNNDQLRTLTYNWLTEDDEFYNISQNIKKWGDLITANARRQIIYKLFEEKNIDDVTIGRIICADVVIVRDMKKKWEVWKKQNEL